MKIRLQEFRVVLFCLAVGVLLMFISCKTDKPQDYIAKVEDKILSKSELRNVIPIGASPEDSIKLSNIFIDNWIRKQVVLLQADINLSNLEKNVESELESYENDLIIYRFERELIKQKLDTAVGVQELEDYYLENIEMFKLKDLALRVTYVKIPANSENKTLVRKYLGSTIDRDSTALKSICDLPGHQCYLKKKDWIYFKDLLREVPLTIYNAERFLKTNKFVEFDSDEETYMLDIKEYKLKDSYSPIDLETKNIKSIILNARKIQLLEKMREELFQKAIKNGSVEINK